MNCFEVNYFACYFKRISEHIGANRGIIEKELNELLKLCRWDCIDNYLALETLKRTRLKLTKIVKKYKVRLLLLSKFADMFFILSKYGSVS